MQSIRHRGLLTAVALAGVAAVLVTIVLFAGVATSAGLATESHRSARPVPATPVGFGSPGAASNMAARVAVLKQRTGRLSQRQAAGRDLVARVAKRNVNQPSPIVLTPCPDGSAFLCGTYNAPLNRGNPHDHRMIGVQFEVLPHSNAGPAAGAIFFSEGGPGFSVLNTSRDGYGFYVLGPLTDQRDVVLIDQRGLGQSQVIDCPDFQHGVGDVYTAAAKCHDQLGDAADLYGTRDVALDMEGIRAGLGYDRIDVLGASASGNEATTYAALFPQHVRSVTLGSPYASAAFEPWDPYVPEALPHIVSQLCARSVSCAQLNPETADTLAWLVQRLRAHPVEGDALDVSGNLHHVRVTESVLVARILTDGFDQVGPGLIVQAAEALRRNDPVPLLRLGANHDPSSVFEDGGDPAFFSAGDQLARICVDSPWPWDKQAPLPVRLAQYGRAKQQQPQQYGLFARDAWLVSGTFLKFPSACIASRWGDRQPQPPGTRIAAPALIEAGEYDTILPTAQVRRVAALYRNATFVEVAAAGHVPWWGSSCALDLMQRFIATLHAGDTSCAAQPAGTFWVPGSFPTRAADAPQATPAVGDESKPGDRRLATIAAWTVLDALYQSFQADTGVQPGLRGGSITSSNGTSCDDPLLYTFAGARFTNDVATSGSIVLPCDTPNAGDLTVTGPGGLTASLHVTVPLGSGAAGDVVTLAGTIGGRAVNLTVPAT